MSSNGAAALSSAPPSEVDDQRLDTIGFNRKECLKLLKSMNNLCKVIMQLKILPRLKNEMQTKIKKSIHLILQGAILGCFRKRRKALGRLYIASKDRQGLDELNFHVDEMHATRNEQTSVCIMDGVHSSMVYRPSQAPSLNDAGVGIEQQISQVIELLDWENDKPEVAFVILGIGGAGKITLADAFSGYEKVSSNESRIFFAYEELQPSTQVLRRHSLTYAHSFMRGSRMHWGRELTTKPRRGSSTQKNRA